MNTLHALYTMSGIILLIALILCYTLVVVLSQLE